MFYKHAVVAAAFRIYAQNSHGNYIVDHGISWKNHGIELFLNFCENPDKCLAVLYADHLPAMLC